MMIFADSTAMPSLKISHNKKKARRSVGHHSHRPTPTKATLQGRVSAGPFGKHDYRKEMASVLSKTEENRSVSNGIHMKKVLGGDKKKTFAPLLGKRKACRDAEVALQLHYKDVEGGTPQGKVKEGKRIGHENGHSGSVSKGGSVGSGGGSVGKMEKYSNGSTVKEHNHEKMGPMEAKKEIKVLASPPPLKRLKPSGPDIKREEKQANCLNSKQPALVLKNIKKAGKKMDRVSDVVHTDNYVRRMASLNASACVTAMMESEKRTFSKAIRNPEASLKTSYRQSISKSPSSAESDKEGVFTFGETAITGAAGYQRSPTPSSCSSMSSDSQSLSYSDLEMPEPQLVGTILDLLAQQSSSDDDIPYNCLGLLYNGDTIYPTARVFFNSDTDLTLPYKIIPRVFPSRDFFVKAATRQVLPFKSAGKKKKAAKGNNGWMTLGEPIKVIEYCKDGQNISRKFYAGIRRNGGKEIICVRDNIVVRAGGDEVGEKPYIAKISSIWRESAGQVMMTVFWYYRPDELDGATVQTSNFQKDELLASQHHDDNSVACIEDKCHILGVSQYCRYIAYVKAIMSGSKWKGGMAIPPVPSSSDITDFTGETQTGLLSDSYQCLLQPNLGTNSLSKLMGQGAHNFMEPDVQLFPSIDPGLVFLCYRGYNHCVGKLSSRSFK